MWAEAGFQAIFAVPFLLVICMPSSPGLRKCIYILAIVMAILGVLLYCVSLIFTFVYFDEWLDAC